MMRSGARCVAGSEVMQVSRAGTLPRKSHPKSRFVRRRIVAVAHAVIAAALAGTRRAPDARRAWSKYPRSPLPTTARSGAEPAYRAYEIERLLGTGGMGSVYRARHVLDDRVVAIKVLREDQLEQERAVDRMMREASILATVAHGGIPRFYECGLLGDGRPWIAMELVQGTPLSLRLHEGPLPHCDVMDFVGNVAGVLAAAHARGVTHRDLKPDNILLTPMDPRTPCA